MAASEIEQEPIAVLQSRRDILSSEDDIRLDDYLNDKLQTAADFQNLDNLIASVESQRALLQSQVCLFRITMATCANSLSFKMLNRKQSSPSKWLLRIPNSY